MPEAQVNNTECEPENGQFTRFPNDLLDHLCSIRIAARERQILDVIIRQTYGYHRHEASISYADFSEATGLDKRSVRDCVASLENNMVIISVPGGFRSSKAYSVNEDFGSWTMRKNTHSAQKHAQCIKTRTGCAQKHAQSLCVKTRTPSIKENIKKDLKKAPEKIPGEFKKKSLIPKNYPMTDYHLSYAEGKGFDLKTIEAMFEKFRAHHEAKGTQFKSWQAAWRTWILNQIQYHGEPGQATTQQMTNEEILA